jgi:hypothetical protein
MAIQTIVNYAIIIGTGFYIYLLFKQKWDKELKGDKKMSLIGDAFKDIMPKKQAKKEETREERLLRMRLEIDKELNQLPKFTVPTPPVEEVVVPIESRLEVLEHNLSVIFQDIDEKFKDFEARLTIVERVMLKGIK